MIQRENMPFIIPILQACGSLIVYGLIICVYRLTIHPLARYPGPWLGRISSLYATYHTYVGDIHIDMMLCHEKYGDVVRYQPNRLLFNTNIALKDIYGYGKNTKKSAAYHQFPTNYSYSTHNVVDKNMHQRKRKLVSQAFSPPNMKIWLDALQEQLNILCEQLSTGFLSKKSTSRTIVTGWSSPCRMSHLCLCLLTDVVMEAVFSDSLHTLTSTENWYMLELVHKTYEWLGLVFQCPKLSKFRLDRILLPDLCKARKSLRGIFGKVLRQRLEMRATQGDVYDVYLGAIDPDNGEKWSITELGAEALLLFGAGPDATSSSMSSAFFYIAHNPEVYKKVVDEVRAAFQSVNEIGPGTALSGCQYLRACIDEAQRMNPANGAALWREIDAGGASIDGEQLPAGVDVGVSIYTIHRNPKYFPDPFAFKPERWIVDQGKPEADVSLARSAWNPFSLGPRGCVGRPVAMLQLTVTLARIYWQFDVRLPLEPALASLGCGRTGAKFGRHRPGEFQSRCSFQNSVEGPMLEFKDRIRTLRDAKF